MNEVVTRVHFDLPDTIPNKPILFPLELPLNNEQLTHTVPFSACKLGDEPPSETAPHDAEYPAAVPVTRASNIPLPHTNAPQVPQFERLIDRLLANGLIDLQDKIIWEQLCQSASTEQGSSYIMKTWEKNDKAGRRMPHAPQCHTPDSSPFPGATTTSFRLDNFLLLMGDEQPETTACLTRGFKEGFRIEIDEDFRDLYETTIFQNGKNPSLVADEAIAQTFRDDRALGYTAARPPLWGAVYVASPVRAEPKRSSGEDTGKFRKVQNLSKEGGDMPSINAGILPHNTRIQYATVEDAAREIKQLKTATGKKILLSKYDQWHAYRLVPVHPDDVGLLGFRDNEQPPNEYVELRMPFGLASACRIYSCLSNTIGWAFQHIVGAGTFKVYLDDFLQINAGDETSAVASTMTLSSFAILGMRLNDKTECDVTSIVFLGVLLDTEAETLSVTTERKAHISRIITTWLGRERFLTSELESLVGTLSFISRVIKPGKIFLLRLWATLAHCRTRHHASPHDISAEMRQDLLWWDRFLSVWNGTCAMVDGTEEIIPDVHTTQDASGFGGASVLEYEFAQVQWEGELRYLSQKHINVREMFMIVTTALTFGRRWTGKLVVFHCDNKSDVFAALRGKSKNKDIMHLIRVLHYAAAIFGFTYDIRHIAGVLNVVADRASRMPVHEFLQECPGPYVAVQPILPPRHDSPTWETLMSELAQAALAARR